MKFVYIGKGMEITDSLKARVEKKLTKLERYFQDDVEAQIRFPRSAATAVSSRLPSASAA